MSWWFESWQGPARVALVGVAAYAVLLCVLRVSGKRTLGKFNAFDFVVTIALGSTLASILTDRSLTLAEGTTALLVLIGLQYLVAWTSVRSAAMRRLTRSEPTMLVHDGRLLEHAMRRERVTRATVESALRASGIADVGEAAAVVLETNGELSVLRRADRGAAGSTLASVRGADG